MTRRELFQLTSQNDTPDGVLNLSSSAGDNAADTVGWDRRYGADGLHTDEFIDIWYQSVVGLLCDWETPAEVQAWFASHGVRF